jgi:hypothetical protein
MKKLTTLTAAALGALAAFYAWGGWVYEGKWGSYGTGNGQFINPASVAVAPNGNVYVVDFGNDRVQYFTSTGSFLGKWGKWGEGNGEFEMPTGDGGRCTFKDLLFGFDDGKLTATKHNYKPAWLNNVTVGE